jgi:molecular chaperone GrpE (heat shock protein)
LATANQRQQIKRLEEEVQKYRESYERAHKFFVGLESRFQQQQQQQRSEESFGEEELQQRCVYCSVYII